MALWQRLCLFWVGGGLLGERGKLFLQVCKDLELLRRPQTALKTNAASLAQGGQHPGPSPAPWEQSGYRFVGGAQEATGEDENC